MQELREGSELQNGKYRIVRMLGQGGFGITYEGVQTGLERRVAIKEFFMKEYCNRDGQTSQVSIGSEGSRDMVSDFKVKFLKEAQLIARMEDAPHVVRIHDIFEENGTAYYVMEFLGGGSLNDILKREGPMPEARAIGYVRQIGEALNYLHALNTLHLDIKPSNVLINKKGEAVLIDFGVSKHYDQSGSQTSSTPVGLSKGFAPTEQYQSGGVQQFTPATEVYSLGATLYNLLTGQVPPEASAVFEDGLPPRPHYVSQQTWAAIEQAMQPRRKDRTQTVADFLRALSAPKPEPAPKPQPTPKPAPKPNPQPKPTPAPKPAQESSETVVAQANTNTAKGDFFAIGIIAALLPQMIWTIFIQGNTIFEYSNLDYWSYYDFTPFDLLFRDLLNTALILALTAGYGLLRIRKGKASHAAVYDLVVVGIGAVLLFFFRYFGGYITYLMYDYMGAYIKVWTLLVINFALLLGIGLACAYFIRKNHPCRRWLRWLSIISLSIFVVFYVYDFIYINFLRYYL